MFILIVFLNLYLIIGVCINNPNFNTLQWLGILGLLQLIYSVYSWIKKSGTFISPYVLFLITLYLFSCGQLLLYSFDLITLRDLIITYCISIDSIYRASLYTLVLLNCYQIGALYIVDKRIKKLKLNVIFDTSTEKRTRNIGWFLFVFSIFSYYYQLLTDLIYSIIYGYGELYNREQLIGLSNINSFIADLFIPALICLFLSYTNNRKLLVFISAIFLINAVLLIIIGGRSEAVIICALLLIMYNTAVKRLNRKQFLLIVFGGYFFLIGLNIVAQFRNMDQKNISEIVKDIKEDDDDNNKAVETLGEMGWTMFNLVKTMEIIPNQENFRYGSSYLCSFTSLIPNLGFWDIHPSKKWSNMGEWLTDKLDSNFGTGYSMCAEAYANFGYWGFLVFFLWGGLFAYILAESELYAQNKNLSLLLFAFLFLWFALKLPRNSFLPMVRYMAFYIFPIYFCSKGFLINNKI